MFLTVTRSLLEGFGTTCLVFFAVVKVKKLLQKVIE